MYLKFLYYSHVKVTKILNIIISKIQNFKLQKSRISKIDKVLGEYNW